MVLSSITISAWLIKPLIGYLIDNFLNKKVWVFFSLSLDIALVLVLGLLQLPIFILFAILEQFGLSYSGSIHAWGACGGSSILPSPIDYLKI